MYNMGPLWESRKLQTKLDYYYYAKVEMACDTIIMF